MLSPWGDFAYGFFDKNPWVSITPAVLCPAAVESEPVISPVVS